MSKEKIAQLRKHVSPFEKSDLRISIRQMVNTILPFLVAWFLAYQSLRVSVWLMVPFRDDCRWFRRSDVHHLPRLYARIVFQK